jgi:S-DNA-T family DNA segregation ATPase FtsK/SpoIIIE
VQELQRVFNGLGIKGTVIRKTEGCRIITYEFKMHNGLLPPGINRILSAIKIQLGVESVKLIEVPESNAYGIEVECKERKTVKIGDVMRSREYTEDKRRLKFILGETPKGKKIVGSLVDAKHLLVAGQTGSGKSVFINTLLASLMRESPDRTRLILIDPKRVELSRYKDVPHLLAPVITEVDQAKNILEWLANKHMPYRYKYLEEASGIIGKSYVDLKDMEEDEDKGEIRMVGDPLMPRFVIVIDELAQLLMTSEDRCIEDSIIKIAQLGRACGIHLVVATQRPSADIVTPQIKANIPTKVAFKVSTGSNSRIILDNMGAEKLLGRGDMLYLQEDYFEPKRIQGAFISSEEVDRLVRNLKDNNDPPDYWQDALAAIYGIHRFADILQELSDKGPPGSVDNFINHMVDKGLIILDYETKTMKFAHLQ